MATGGLTVFFLLVAGLFSALEIDVARKEVRSVYRGYHRIARRYSLYHQVEVEPLTGMLKVARLDGRSAGCGHRDRFERLT